MIVYRCDTGECRVLTYEPKSSLHSCPSCKTVGVLLREGVNHVSEFIARRDEYRRIKDAEREATA